MVIPDAIEGESSNSAVERVLREEWFFLWTCKSHAVIPDAIVGKRSDTIERGVRERCYFAGVQKCCMLCLIIMLILLSLKTLPTKKTICAKPNFSTFTLTLLINIINRRQIHNLVIRHVHVALWQTCRSHREWHGLFQRSGLRRCWCHEIVQSIEC